MKNLGFTKFYNSEFGSHFLEFIKKYDSAYSTDCYSQAVKWLGHYDFEAIYYFLNPTPSDLKLPFSIQEFVKLSDSQIAVYQDICSKRLELDVERKNLFEELNSLFK